MGWPQGPEHKLQVPGLTFISFSYERNGFAFFATKRRIKITFYSINDFKKRTS